MTIISGPHLVENAGMVLMAESHIIVHWLGLACWVDVFSCKEFDSQRATHFIQARLKFRSMADTRVVVRGAADVPSPA
jgi:S-adenosylmethionine/arginine decarboxylase-like enzyme